MRATRNPWFPRSLVVSSLGVAVGVWLGAAGTVARAKDPSIATDSGASLSATEAAVVARTNDARARRGLPGQHLVLAPDHMGEILAVDVAVDVAGDNGMMVARGAFLACTPGLGFVLHNAGLQGMLATRGLFFLRTEGSGRLFINGYGGIVEEILAEGERFVVDNRHVVAFSVGMAFESVVLAASLKNSFLSGEGFVVRFTGPGRVLYQTRARPSTGMLRGLFQTLF